MSDHEQYPGSNHGNVTRDQIPHSGRRGYESPVNDFDNTTLEDAHKQGLLVTPENPGALMGNDKKGGLKRKIGLALAGIGLVGTGGFVAKTTMGGEAAPAPEREPSVSAPVNPGEVAEQPQSAEFGLSSAEYLDNPTARVEAYYEQIGQLYVEGITQEVAEDPRRFELGEDAYIDEVTQGISGRFIESLYVEGWENNPRLVADIDNLLTIVDRTRELRLYSYTAIGGDLQPYARELIAESVQTPDNPLITDVAFREADNRYETSVVDNIDGIDINTVTGGEVITWTEVDGQLKISDIQPYTG
jgi:hypothetical protein